jgi:hypothetical protein
MLTGDYVPPRKPRLTPSPDQRDIVKVQAPDRQTGAETAPVKAPGQLQTAPHETPPADHTAGETCGLTYIGNAPNFMVYAIAEERGVKMPNFFGYMLWASLVLLPLLALLTLLPIVPILRAVGGSA